MKKLFLLLFLLPIHHVIAQHHLHVIISQTDTTDPEHIFNVNINGVSVAHMNVILAVGCTYEQKKEANEKYTHLIYRSDDKGKNWVKQTSSLPDFTSYSHAKLRKPFVIDSLHQFIIGDSGLLLRTADAGANWTRLDVHTTWGFKDICFQDKDHGMVVGLAGTYAVTSDGGTTWDLHEHFTNSFFQRCIGFPPATYYLFDKAYGKMFVTRDAGATWDTNYVFTGDNTGWNYKYVQDEVFLDSEHGFGVGGQIDSGSGMGTVYRSLVTETEDGGKTWNIRRNELDRTFRGLFGIDFLTPKTGIAITAIHELVITHDGGKTWALDSVTYDELFYGYNQIHALTSNEFLVTTSGIFNSLFLGTLTPSSVIMRESSKSSVLVYPNPMRTLCTIQLPNLEKCFINVCDILGREVYSTTTAQRFEITFDATNMASGIYTVALRTERGDPPLRTSFVKQ